MLFHLIKSIFINLITILAYFLNPIVTLFCNELGELPNWLRWFATEDNKSADIRWMVYEHCVPSFAEYDYDKHYIYHYEQKGDIEIIPGYVELKDPNFTFKEKVQRYFCRLAWLNRNPVGTLSSLLDIIFNTSTLKVVKNRKDNENELYFAYEYDPTESAFVRIAKLVLYRHFCLWTYIRWCPWFCLRTYWGWKYKFVEPLDRDYRASIAVYCSPFRQSS